MWRLPSPAELLTIVDSSTASPALVSIFTTYGHTFWAAEDAKHSGNAWEIDENGALGSVAKTKTGSVLCVRVRDYDATANRFTAAAETVRDSVSGLMWQKQTVASRTWAEALNYCEEISTADKFDWRLPNRNELASLINYEKANGAASDFPAIAAKGFWTSTSSVAGNEAWTVDFETGKIEASEKTNTKYIICVRNDEPCFGGECADPCSFDACKGMANSTGLCNAGDYSFTCGCKSGFNWNHGKCLLDTTRYIACEGLPENAVWNTVFGISQTYDGEKWYPSEVGTFDKTKSSTECHFICNANYDWDPDGEKCVAQTKLSECTGKPAKSVWNTVDRITQSWNGDAWEPSGTAVFSEEECTDECCFKCKEHFHWSSDNICEPDTTVVECTGLKENASWWNDPHTVTQTWDDIYGDWYPPSIGNYKSDAQGENGCYFKCDENYEWNTAYRMCQAKSKYNVACTDLPEHAVWNIFTTVNQTWNGSEFLPATTGSYNETPDPNECRFKCQNNYFWNGSECMNPCDYDPCGEHSNGLCTASSSSEYECGCIDGYFWNDLRCKKPLNIGHICTGRTKCWNDSEEIECPSEGEGFFGQDAYYASAGDCTPQSFTFKTIENQDIMVDNNTGLEWQPTHQNGTWQYAANYCENLIYAGYDDWRLPAVKELVSLSNNYPFYSLSLSLLWTSTSSAEDPAEAYRVGGGYIYFPVNKNRDIQNFHCVRGSATLPQGTFATETIDGEDVVFDSTSKLMWQKSYVSKNWHDALEYCENLNYAGFDDWKLPNANESVSIMNYEKYDPASDFPDMPVGTFWTSSSSSNSPNGFYLSTYYGTDSTGKPNSSELFVRCVRIRKDVCEPDEFWNGSMCMKNLCYTDPCSGKEHASGGCTPKSSETYICSCDDPDLFWNGSACIPDPCTDDPCSGVENSTHECIPYASDDYECGCNENYVWKDSQCRKALNLGNICVHNTYTLNNTTRQFCSTMDSTIECPSEGEDFFGQDLQYAKAGFCTPKDFTVKSVLGQNIVIDNNTGLKWMQTADENAKYTWEAANDYCENLVYAGYDDWRLPTLKDFFTTANEYDNAFFTYFQGPINSWTSNSFAGGNGSSWMSSVTVGHASGFSNNSDEQYVRCVRGRVLPDGAFITRQIGADEIVADTTTGLIWQKDYAADKNWQEALKYCEDSTYAGFTDWRLPNINELNSIVDYNYYDPASAFPGDVSSEYYYWSSSSNTGATTARYIYFKTGERGYYRPKPTKHFVRCVRSEICGAGEVWSWSAKACVIK